jgi:hypothetical protein
MTANEKLHAEVDRLSPDEAAAAQLVVRQIDDVVDEWGSLSAFTAALMTDAFRGLDAEEREAGCDPW